MRRKAGRRLIVLGLLALGLAPGTWWRSTPSEERRQVLTIVPVDHGEAHDWPPGLSVEGVWALASPDPHFGGYSALLPLGDGRLRAYSDKGDSLAFTVPDRGEPAPDFAAVTPDPQRARHFQDIESATLDPATGRHWLGYEAINAIRRYEPGQGPQDRGRIAFPPEMHDWPYNSGAEAMVRLDDGRFIVFRERGGIGLVFAGDPVDGAPASEFAIDWPQGYLPADAALLPDGRVLVLLRGVRLAWPPFRSQLVAADPARIESRTPWQVEPVARLDGVVPSENYEALALEREGSSLVLWVMSDDNQGAFQRTLLAKLRWEDW